MDQADIPTLLARLKSDEDAVRKMAVFKLQSSINDPSFADVFISSGGLLILRRLILTTSGNTLAYSLQSLSRLLEVDMGWEIFEAAGAGELVERVVELVVTHPLVNILRGAMAILVAVVSHPQHARGSLRTPGAFGLRALKPAVAVYPHFFEMVVSQLSSADHALCANALMLLNSLIRDSITSDGNQGRDGGGKSSGVGEEWPKFIKRLQDLGLIKDVYLLMQSSALQDLAYPLLEFQALSKMLLKKWKDIKVDLERPEHRRALKGLHLASAPDKTQAAPSTKVEQVTGSQVRKASRKHNPEKWRRLGFETETPAWEFDPAGFLGMMDLTDFVRKHEDRFQKILLEQSAKPLYMRCPIARASLAVTAILYEHFEIEKSDTEDLRSYQVLDGVKSHDQTYRPLLLQWSRLHTAGLHSFFRLWKSTGAEQDDFDKVAELVRILVEQVVGEASRTKDIVDVEEELLEFEYSRLRELQVELLESTFEDEWGHHLLQVRDELKHEALQFIKEQRIRCLLQGSWFPRILNQRDGMDDSNFGKTNVPQTAWRYVRLSHNRRFLHYANFAAKVSHQPTLDQLHEKLDLSTISSVVSNVSAPNDETSSLSSSSTVKSLSHVPSRTTTTTKITINSYVNNPGQSRGPDSAQESQERAVLTLSPATQSLASEWLDGLLMLLNQAPITAETAKLVRLVSDYSLKIRLLNVRLEGGTDGLPEGAGVVPSREGLDDDYYYEV